MGEVGPLVLACLLGTSLIVGAAGPALAGLPSPSLQERKVRLPRAYDDYALERFWEYAERILGSRLGYSAETEQDRESVTLQIGVVDLTERDRARLQAAAPEGWVEVEAFPVRYSEGDLRGFGYRAEEALRDEGLDWIWSGFSTEFGAPDRITIHLMEDDYWARKILREELPDDAYSVEVGGGVALLIPTPGGPEGGPGWLVSVAAAAAGAAGLGLTVARRRRPRGATSP